MIWEVPGAAASDREVECRYPLDSELAGRLQECYGHLGRLGYRVVGLELKPMAGPIAPDPAAKPKAVRPAWPKNSVEAKPTPVLMQFVAGSTDQPSRAFVAPPDNLDKIQVLTGPERFLHALRAAADPARPAAERLTRLRCTPGRVGLQAVEVGFGETKSLQPSRWEGAEAWWAAREAEAAAAKKPRSPEPELNL